MLKAEYRQLLSIGSEHPAFDRTLGPDGKPIFEELEALDEMEKAEKKSAKNVCRTELADRVITDAVLPSEYSMHLFQHNETKTLDMYGQQPSDAAMAD